MDLKFTVENREKYVLLGVLGEIDLYNVKQLKDKIAIVVDTSHQANLVVDMADVEYIDSSGLGILIGIKRRIVEKGGKFVLVLRKERILKLFSITGLNRIFEICPSVEDAESRLSV